MERTTRLTLDEFLERLPLIEPTAILVEPRILRRVIRLDRRLPGLSWMVTHQKSYTIPRERLLAFVDRAELGLGTDDDLPPQVILLLAPDDQRPLDFDVVGRYGRLLYHAMIHARLQQRFSDQAAPHELAEQRKQIIGASPFAEIHAVLLSDERLFPDSDDLETYVAFAAEYLELRQFAPQRIPLFFPAITDWSAIERIVDGDVNHAEVLERLRSHGIVVEAQEQTATYEDSVVGAPPAEKTDSEPTDSDEQLPHFCRRLQRALELTDDETACWQGALAHLFSHATGGFWSNEARLLYDLKKVCVEHERGVNRFDLVDWIRTWGEIPIYRPLPLLRDVLSIRHLRKARRRLSTLPLAARSQVIDALMATALTRAEARVRQRLGPILVAVLDRVRLLPRNVPESVARRKMVDEMLDRVIERGYLNMGDLRDAISKNDCKLSDVQSGAELHSGDALLRADRKLDSALDGVYRRGAVYLRWPQTLSSIAFGTHPGRFFTQHLAVPFGAAYLTLEFLRNIVGKFAASDSHHSSAAPNDSTAAPFLAPWMFFGCVILLGLWLHSLIHNPAFRAWNLTMAWRGFRMAKRVFFDLPAALLRSPLVQWILNSRTFAALQHYLFQPAAMTAILWLSVRFVWGTYIGFHLALEAFLAINLLVNSPFGRMVAEITTDFLVRAWHDLRFRVLAGLFQSVMALFDRMAELLEGVVYTVDDWLRFRSGDNRIRQGSKLVGGVIWFFVGYIVVFVFTLLVEPQINPIKHFPVVTVAHKIILPTGPVFVSHLTPYLGIAQANTLVWTTIWLVPGVFGFLVWELKENWRLYASNRPATLRPDAIGHHGETMTQFLRPGFHSGTLPKAYRAIRRAVRKSERTGRYAAVRQKQSLLHHVERNVQHYFERKFCALFEEAHDFCPLRFRVLGVRLATNRIEVELCRCDDETQRFSFAFYDAPPLLVGRIRPADWFDRLHPRERQALSDAIAGLFQCLGVERIEDNPFAIDLTPIAWDHWVAIWTPPDYQRSPVTSATG